MTNKRGTVKLFTFSFETDAHNITSSAPKIFSCAPKNLHLLAKVLPNSNLNLEPPTIQRVLADVIDKDRPSHRQMAVYRIKCCDCQATYIGETGRNLNTGPR